MNTGPEAIGLGGSRPQACRDAWENEGQSFPLVSRLNYVADKGADRGRGIKWGK